MDKPEATASSDGNSAAGPPGPSPDRDGDPSDSEFRLLADNLPVLCWIANGDGYIVWYNRRWHEYCGTTPEQMEGWGWQSVHDPAVLPDVMERWKRSIASGERFEMTFPLRGADGAFRPFLTRVQPVREPGSATLRWFGVNTEITEQVAAEAALKESETRFREVANAAPVLIWVADKRNKGVWYNKAWLDFTGRSMDQELGDGWLEGVHPDDRPRCAEICGGSFERREPFRLDFRLRRADGEWRVLDDTGVPRFSETGDFVGYIGSCIDVTDARRSEAALRESEESYRRIFEQTSDLVITADLDQVITDCNPAAAVAVGLSRRETIGRKISDFVSPEDFERTTSMLRQKLEQGGTTRYDVRVRSHSGDWLYWEINSGLTFNEEGRPIGLHVVGRDVTERKRLEKYQRLLVGELNHRVKNTLAIVQSLAHQTFREEASPREAIRSFEGRLEALAAAHNLLTRESWESASISEVVIHVLAPFCSTERCRIEGPELRLPPKLAVGLALAVHELATNAAKYGALSTDSGELSITWSIDAEILELQWREQGGPPVREPSKEGFGTRMIKRGLSSEFGGNVELSFDPDGVSCRVSAPVPRVEQGSGSNSGGSAL